MDHCREQLIIQVTNQLRKIEAMRAQRFGHRYDPEKIAYAVREIPTGRLELMAIALDANIYSFECELKPFGS